MANRDALVSVKDVDTLTALIARVNDAKTSASWAPVFRKILEDYPGLWRYAGDLAHDTALRLIKSAHGTPAFNESLERGLKELRAELGYETAPGLEKLLIEQVVMCWLRLRLLEAAPVPQVGPFRLTEATDRQDDRLAKAQRAFLQASETLARVRKLAQRTPELMQINIGAKQVNVVKGENPQIQAGPD